MRKYYLTTTVIWLSLTLLSTIIAIIKTIQAGIHSSWWYVVAAGLSTLILCLRYIRWKNISKEKHSNNT